MDELKQFKYDSARELFDVGDAPLVRYSSDENLQLIIVDVANLDDRGKEQWRYAIGQCITELPSTITDANLIEMHADITTRTECNVNNLFDMRKIKDAINDTPLYTLYYEERNGVEIGMAYYENESVNSGTLCFDVIHSPNGNITITKIHNYGFLIHTSNVNIAFIHNDDIYTVLHFNPQNCYMHQAELPSYYACNNAIPFDDKTRDVLKSAHARHVASLYHANMYNLLNRQKCKCK